MGKYFTAIAVPDATAYHLVYDSRKLVEGFDRSAISFERPVLKSAKNTDTFRFYMGPMKKEILARYNDSSKNQFGISGLHADEVVTSSILIGWLATLMKYILDFFYLLIPNYGIAIILLTLLTKLVFLPLTFKSSESMAKMAALNPKMAEIRARLKDKPDKMNQEIAELYKREKVNPLSGCLPLLLQMPVFFALYNLLNSHFELRGALFIPGWIPDLSAPESILNFPFTIPLLGWTALRVPAPPDGGEPAPVQQVHRSRPARAAAGRRPGEAVHVRAAHRVPVHPLRHAVGARAVLDRPEHPLHGPAGVHQLAAEEEGRGSSGQTPVLVKASAKPGRQGPMRGSRANEHSNVQGD